MVPKTWLSTPLTVARTAPPANIVLQLALRALADAMSVLLVFSETRRRQAFRHHRARDHALQDCSALLGQQRVHLARLARTKARLGKDHARRVLKESMA